jgi:FixJ family two-component response regulator
MSEIFVVDDDPAVGAALSIILRSAGFEITSFVEGDAYGCALAHARMHSARRSPVKLLRP